MKTVVTALKINGEEVKFFSEKDMCATLLKLCIENGKYQPITNIKKNVIEMLKLLSELVTNAHLKKKINNSLLWLGRYKDRNLILESIYNLILSFEGLTFYTQKP